MTTLPAISLHQPWATLCATRATWPDDLLFGVVPQSGVPRCPMVKRFETRSRPCPPKYIGQRVAIHAALRESEQWDEFGDYRVMRLDCDDKRHRWVLEPIEDGEGVGLHACIPLPLGAVVATAVVTASLPIVQFLSQHPGHRPDPSWRPDDGTGRPPYPLVGLNSNAERLTHHHGGEAVDITDQLPYGDYRPGRWAWALADVEPVDPPVPAKGRQGWFTVELP